MKEMQLRNTAIGIVWLAAMIGSGCEEPLRSTPDSVEPAVVAAAETGDLSALSSNAIDLPADDPSSVLNAAEFEPLEEECCTGPGDVAECWLADAEDDGVLCSKHDDCPSSQCNFSKGRCMCKNDAECNNGICADSGICGPSWCNGYRKCSCWGGCEWWAEDPDYTLYDMATESGRYCCEGVYSEDPITIDPILGGFFSITTCGRCSKTSDCDDNNPCTLDVCDDGTCANNKLNGSLSQVPDAIDCPMNSSLYSSDCARQKCDNGVCAIELDWKVGQVCVNGPDNVPATYQASCYSRACTAAGKCATTVKTNDSCAVPGNMCASGKCSSDAICVAEPLTVAAANAQPQCCVPTTSSTFDDGQVCTDDFCCQGLATDPPTCNGVLPFWDRYLPDSSNAAGCCLDSYGCNDNNTCTKDICCGSANTALAQCGGVASWNCKTALNQLPGCCDDNLDCEDGLACTQNLCGTDSRCVAATPLAGGGCCDPSGGPSGCDDANICTLETCDSVTMSCDSEPDPTAPDPCCDINGCADMDSNECTVETCCDPTNADAICNGVDDWSCSPTLEIKRLANGAVYPGCCVNASDCNDGNDCTADTCVNSRCVFNPLADPSTTGGKCCNVGGANTSQCGDVDAGNCTENVCCSAAMVAAAVSASDPCWKEPAWSCENPVITPSPLGCCTDVTDCGSSTDPCVVTSCAANGNCEWDFYKDPITGKPSAGCCELNADCLQPDVSRPCLDSSSCDIIADPLINPNYARCDYVPEASTYNCGIAPSGCRGSQCGLTPEANNWKCTTANLAAGDLCTLPNGTPNCAGLVCNGTGKCNGVVPGTVVRDNDTCSRPEDLGSAASITLTNEASTCSVNDYKPVTTGVFADCGAGLSTYSDVTYAVGGYIDDLYQLKHRALRVTPTGTAWDPVIYARSICGSENLQLACNDDCSSMTGDSNYDGAATCAANDSLVVVGPLAVEDIPNHPDPILPVSSQDFDRNVVRDAYDVYRDNGSVALIVDSHASSPNNGGIFDISALMESHSNNDCRNIAAYTAAPTIDGTFQWKERWRGNTTGFKNYFGATGPAMGLVGATDVNNPAQAFFKVAIPSGAGQYVAYVDNMSLKKRGEAGNVIAGDAATNAASASFFEPVLSTLTISGNDCSSVNPVSRAYGTAAGSFPVPWFTLDASAAAVNQYLAVSNKQLNALGSYELTVVKAQPKFVGFHTVYGAGNNSIGIKHILTTFPSAGKRLDFVPNGKGMNGYVMTFAKVGASGYGPDTCGGPANTGWMVHPTCYAGGTAIGYKSTSNGTLADQNVIELPFPFPMGGRFNKYLYFDKNGRIEPRTTSVSSSSAAVPSLDLFYQVDQPVIAGAWGAFGGGSMTAQAVVFEGTLAYVITWSGYSSSNKAKDISFQVILRIDGRIAFYYRPGTSTMVEGTEALVGLSGGTGSATCTTVTKKNDLGTWVPDETECVYAPIGYGDNSYCYKFATRNGCVRWVYPTADGLPGITNEN